MAEAEAQEAPFDLYPRLAGLDSCEDTMHVATPALTKSEALANNDVYVVVKRAFPAFVEALLPQLVRQAGTG